MEGVMNMAKKRRGRRRKSLSGYFKQVINENPSWLDGSGTNALILQRFQADHPNKSITNKIKANLANVKSVLRKGKRRRGGVRVSPHLVAARMTPGFAATRSLAGLEEYIDECLTLAKNLDRVGLDHVIRLLRNARNHVVWKMGR
jgi:hypothetical protein